MAPDQRPRALEVEIETLRTVGAAYGINIREAPRREQRRGGTLALQHRVDGDRGAVQELRNGLRSEPGESQALHHAASRRIRGGRALGADQPLLTDGDQVGESSTDIHPHYRARLFHATSGARRTRSRRDVPARSTPRQ